MSDNELPTKLEAHRKATVAMQKRERERVKNMLGALDGNVAAAIKSGEFSYTEWYMDGVGGQDAKIFWKHRDIFKQHYERLGFKTDVEAKGHYKCSKEEIWHPLRYRLKKLVGLIPEEKVERYDVHFTVEW